MPTSSTKHKLPGLYYVSYHGSTSGRLGLQYTNINPNLRVLVVPPYTYEYVMFFRIYDRFPGNVDGLECQNMNIYGVYRKPSKTSIQILFQEGSKIFKIFTCFVSRLEISVRDCFKLVV